MRSIFVLLILVMIGLNGKGQSVTALPDSVLSQCCLEVTLLNGNVTTVDWVFIQYITRDGTGTKLFVEYAPNFGGIQWETQIRIQDNFDDVIARSKFIVIPFTVGTTDYGINRNWIANIEENTTTGGTWIYGRFGTPTKRKFSAVEDYETLKNLLLACRPRAIVVAENGLYTEGDTVRMGGFLIEPTKIRTEGYNFQMKDEASSAEFGLDYNSPFGDTSVYSARRTGKWRLLNTMGRRYWGVFMEDTTGVSGIDNRIEHGFYAGSDDPYIQIFTKSGVGSNAKINWLINAYDGGSWTYKDGSVNPYYTHGFSTSQAGTVMGSSESGTGDPGSGVRITTNGFGVGADEWIGIVTKNVDNGAATNGQFLQLVDNSNGKVEFATINLSGYLQISDTAAMLSPYIRTAGWGLIKSPYTLRVDSTLLATRTYTNRFLLRSDTTGMLAPYIDGFGMATRIPIFTGSRTIGNSPITYNSTTKRTTWDSPGVIKLPMGTDAQRPSPATTSDFWYNTTSNGVEWHNGTRWAYAVESSITTGTNTWVPYFNAQNQLTASNQLLFTGTLLRVTANGNSAGFQMINQSTATNALALFEVVNNAGIFADYGISGSNYTANAVVGASSAYTLFPNNGNAWLFPLTTSTHRIAFNNTERYRFTNDGFLLGGTTANYQLQQYSTGAFGIARGAVAQRPIIAANTTPVRFNTDSIALEYGDGVSWLQLATRAYARSMRTTDTWLGTRLASSDVQISSNNNSLRLNNLDTMKMNNAIITTPGTANLLLLNPDVGSTGYESTGGGYHTNINGTMKTNPGYANIVIGATNESGGHYHMIGIGYGSSVQGIGAIAIGYDADATGSTTPMAIGYGSRADEAREISIGSNEYDKLNLWAGLSGGRIVAVNYGTGTKTATALSKTQSNYIVGLATDGTALDLERKRDTTIIITDASYNFGTAVTTAQVLSRYNRVVIYIKCTSAATANNTVTLHTPDANLAQTEIIIHSIDDNGSFRNDINFTTNGAVNTLGATITTYNLSAGQQLRIRTVNDSGWKYFFGF